MGEHLNYLYIQEMDGMDGWYNHPLYTTYTDQWCRNRGEGPPPQYTEWGQNMLGPPIIITKFLLNYLFER